MNQGIHFPSKFSIGTDPGININFTILIIKNMHSKEVELDLPKGISTRCAVQGDWIFLGFFGHSYKPTQPMHNTGSYPHSI